jgi:hypothetical protein
MTHTIALVPGYASLDIVKWERDVPHYAKLMAVHTDGTVSIWSPIWGATVLDTLEGWTVMRTGELLAIPAPTTN